MAVTTICSHWSTTSNSWICSRLFSVRPKCMVMVRIRVQVSVNSDRVRVMYIILSVLDGK